MARNQNIDPEAGLGGAADDVQPVTPPPPDPWAIMQGVASALQAISERLAQPQTPAQDHTADLIKAQLALSGALDRMGDAQMKGSELIAQETRRAHRPSNEVVPQISVFNRVGTLVDGYEKPKLKCSMAVPWDLEDESCTREEVELANLLQQGEYVVRMSDRTPLKMAIKVTLKLDNKTPSTLAIIHETAFNKDNFRNVPPLTEFFRQLLKQHDPETRARAAAVLSDEEEEALILAGQLNVVIDGYNQRNAQRQEVAVG